MNDNDEKKSPRRRRAVALRYDVSHDDAPRVIAKGAGLLAERIIEIAKQHGVYVHEDPELAAVLAKLEIDAYVPEELYRAVAEVLAFVYRLSQRMSPRPS